MNLNFTQKSDISQGILPVWKYRSETLSELLVRIKEAHNIPETVPVTYAGRLDPMAEGLVLLLLGEMCKEKPRYSGLDKTYTFEVLLGVATDTYDVLGVVTNHKKVEQVDKESLDRVIAEILTQTSWSYPPYSSRTVSGVPLFTHARAGTLPDVLPTKEGRVQSLLINGTKPTTLSAFIETICSDVSKVSGDFRQEKIVASWQEIQDMPVVLMRMTVTVSSGVYIRSIAQLIGEKLGVPALAYSITRTSIGEYEITKPVL